MYQQTKLPQTKSALTCRSLDLHVVHRLHEAGGGHQEGGVADPACGGDDLTAPPVHRLGGHHGVQDLELDIADGLIAEGTLSRAPLESLHREVAAEDQLCWKERSVN